MFKKRTLMTVLSLVFLFAIIPLNACQDNKDDSTGKLEKTEYTVIFDSNGGSSVENATVKEGDIVTKPVNPTKTTSAITYEFEGWYDGETLWNFELNTVTSNITLKAKWKVGDIYSEEFLPSK